ncbi:multisubunit Na+/H+ antiporter MnhF subunit [Silvimonas terrae]|uniref:Multisubunit Na+/H+ antiporter MnhF subunit n=1 Tax=Silvimonas terrae TaxID=300266 RepID=A0A840RFY7_9NEIS|nr:twin transmembrane helix small protein [Silvimonas terrae]MBB5192245.1 multisubunit Na+/H+ antiporter MnhF subunit [Silvimonas terrae]
MRVVIVLFLLIILFALGRALFQLVRGPSRSEKLARSLTLRIAVSVALFILLLLAWYFGLLQPHGPTP